MTGYATGACLAFLIGLTAATLPLRSLAVAQRLAPAGGPAKAEVESLSESEVRALQDALIWTGDYSGVVNGTIGSRTRDAIAAYVKRLGSAAAGSLDAGTRAHLFAEAKARRQEAGFAPVTDKRAGFVFALPMKLLSRETGTESGTRFSSADGEIVVDTLARPAANGGLPEVFARMSATAGARKVTYKLLRPDFLVVSGEIGDHTFYSRFAAGRVDGTDVLRGFTLTYPKADAARLDAVTLAVAASFDPFPAAAKPVAEDVQPHGASAAPPPTLTEAVLVGSGLALSRVSRLTCASPRIDGAAAPYRLEDGPTGLALLSAPGGAGPPVPVATEPVAEGETLFAFFHGGSDQNGKPGPLLAAPAQVRQADGPDGSVFVISAPFQANAAAPPLFDRSGALVGVAEAKDKVLPAVAGTVPQADYRVTGAVGIAAFLGSAGVARRTVPQPPSLGLGEVASALRLSVVTVACAGGNTAAP